MVTGQKIGFKVLVKGQYYSTFKDSDGHRQKKIRNYTADFVLPDMEAALSKIRNFLLDKYLKKKYEDYTKFRTHTIMKVETLGGQEVQDVRYMGVKMLRQYIDAKGLGVDVTMLTEVQELRDAIRLIEEDPEKFKKWISKIGASKQSEALLRELNPEMFEDKEDMPNESSIGDNKKEDGKKESDFTI